MSKTTQHHDGGTVCQLCGEKGSIRKVTRMLSRFLRTSEDERHLCRECISLLEESPSEEQGACDWCGESGIAETYWREEPGEMGGTRKIAEICRGCFDQ